MSPNIFIIQKQIEYTAKENSSKLCNDSAVLNLHHDNEVKEVVSSQPSITWYKSANQKIGIRTVYESWIIKWLYLMYFIVSEGLQVNFDNSRAMSALTFLLFKLNTLPPKKSSNFESTEAMV